MHYISTRGEAPRLDFEETMLAGLARDGGLYVPEKVPQLTAGEIAALAGLPYEEVAFRVIRPFVGESFTGSALERLIDAAYASFGHKARVPLVELDPATFLMELHHGPTLAFKDVAMQLIGRLFDAVLTRRGERVTIVGATSGDTGSAAIEAFRGLPSVDVFILFPEGRVSEVQRRQMTTPAEDNVHAIAIRGDFDDAQALVKGLFNDHAFRDEVGLAGVNSINWARVLAQTVYYFTAAVALGGPHRPVRFVVPTGNFGDIYAGSVARAMGLPVERLVIATNQNDILHRALTTGEYRRGEVRPSISPSMDIQVSSNFERALFEALDRDAAAVRELMAALTEEGGFTIPAPALARLREIYISGAASEEETRATIARIHAETGEIVCPHTAVGLKVAADLPAPEGVPTVALATAHPAKFPDAVEQAIGLRPALPPRMADLFERPERMHVIDNDLAAVRDFIRRNRRG